MSLTRSSPARTNSQTPTSTTRRAAVMKELDHRVAVVLHDRAVPLLRISLAVVFMWFGVLKLAGLSPAGPLVADTVPWLNPTWFVPALGAVELLLGAALLLDRARTLVAGILAAHLAGTFLTFVMQPETTFQHGNPLLLTLVGEFVLKNLVLLCAALVLAEPIRSPRPALTTAHPS